MLWASGLDSNLWYVRNPFCTLTKMSVLFRFVLQGVTGSNGTKGTLGDQGSIVSSPYQCLVLVILILIVLCSILLLNLLLDYQLIAY